MHKPKALNVYCCSACSEVQVKTTTPKIRGCKKAAFHNWMTVGEKGLNKYICQGCGVKVNTVDVPLLNGCLGGKNHLWNKV
jgi:hypothetical protein